MVSFIVWEDLIQKEKEFFSPERVNFMDEVRTVSTLNLLEAATALGYTETIFKNLLRNNGIKRWPARYVNVINRLKQEFDSFNKDDQKFIKRLIQIDLFKCGGEFNDTTKSRLSVMLKKNHKLNFRALRRSSE